MQVTQDQPETQHAGTSGNVWAVFGHWPKESCARPKSYLTEGMGEDDLYFTWCPTGCRALSPRCLASATRRGFFLGVFCGGPPVLFIDGNNWYHSLSGLGVRDLSRLHYGKISEKLVGPREWLGTRYYIGKVQQAKNRRLYADQRRFLSGL